MASAHVKKVQTRTGTRWIVRYRPGGRSSPTRHAGSFKTAKLADTRLEAVLKALAEGHEPVFDMDTGLVVTVTTAFDRYKASRLDWSDGTVKIFNQAQARLDKLGRKDVRRVTVEDVQAWVKGLLEDLAVSSVRKYLNQLQAVLDDAGLEPNPSRSARVKLPKQVVEEVSPPSGHELEAMLNDLRKPRRGQRASTRRYPLVCELLVATGLRIEELQLLRWQDIDFAGGRLRVARDRTKGGTHGRRFVPLPARLVASLAEIRGDDGPVFPGLSDDGLRNAMARACGRAGVPAYSPHDLRHRYASLMVMAGVPPTRVSQLVGHAKTSLTVDTYSHVMMDEDAGVLEEMRALAGVS